MWVMQVMERDHLDCEVWHDVATKPTAPPYRFPTAEEALDALHQHYPKLSRDVCSACSTVRVRDEESGEVQWPRLARGQ